MYEIKQPDYSARINFCNWLLQNVHDGVMDPQLLFITDTARSYISDHVNMRKCNNMEWWKSPHAIQQVP
jgi:hypothetical protein